MARIDDIGRDIPSDPSVTQIFDKSVAKINDIITLARSLVPIDEETDKMLEKNVPRQYAALRAIIEAADLLQETVEDLDVLQSKRQEYQGDLKALTEKAISQGFVLQNMKHDIVIQYLLEEAAKSGELAAIVAGLPPPVKEKLEKALVEVQ